VSPAGYFNFTPSQEATHNSIKHCCFCEGVLGVVAEVMMLTVMEVSPCLLMIEVALQ